MNLMPTSFRYWLAILVLLAIGACQRASYSFQATPGSAGQSSASATVTEPSPRPTVAGASRAASATRQPAAGPRLRSRFISTLAQHFAKPLARLQAPLPPAKQAAAAPHRAASRIAAHQDPTPGASPAHRRTKGIALLLAFLLGGIGAHLFYLGYYGRGTAYLVATLASLLLLVLAVIGSIATLYGGGAGFMGLIIAGLLISFAVSILSLVDIIRIIIGDLKPKNGEYFPRFFQTRDTSKQPTR